tara:strand:+ start:237 stop:380 length:144 start_codon:yes stop_codon:yes gene_type:complete
LLLATGSAVGQTMVLKHLLIAPGNAGGAASGGIHAAGEVEKSRDQFN